jgi:hypothetical protein
MVDNHWYIGLCLVLVLIYVDDDVIMDYLLCIC